MGTIMQFLGPVIFWFLERWIQSAAKKKEFQESYYAFLNAVDKSGAVKVANHLAAHQALEDEQKRLEEELANKDKQQ